VFILRAVRQLSCREIAARLGLSLAAVKNLSHRARVSLTGQR
jgi:DNA-directed RNA polymerase specialized sigma24 family protein